MAAPGAWQAGGLLNCCSDCGVCCTTMFCPCVTFSENRRRLYGGALGNGCDPCCVYFCVCCCTGCECLYAMGTRTELRAKYGLPEQPCSDCCVHCLCHRCALCQEARELKMRPITAWNPVGRQLPAPTNLMMLQPAAQRAAPVASLTNSSAGNSFAGSFVHPATHPAGMMTQHIGPAGPPRVPLSPPPMGPPAVPVTPPPGPSPGPWMFTNTPSQLSKF